MPAVIPFIPYIVSAAAVGYGAYSQNKAAKDAARVDTATADFNAKYDESLATQLDLDTRENVRMMREEDAAYLSRQEASYAAAGVLANTGSALDAQIMNAGKLEQRVQQEWLNSLQQQNRYRSMASAGRLEGEAQAKSDRMSGNLALINGGAKLAGMTYNAYQSGVFS